ncbi:LysE family translocator [Terrilactibacillus laevilacticus]|uniref:LysE family translocator n=1 Tax=Terrilactibacillus laevilacticus TaxID=1380157 RepID=A0ABW5PTV4_9BACI|nr:LysE family transporter [Terrilactibacillus laevilacticus]
MSSFIEGFALGMVLQLSIGPVFFGVLHLSISKGFFEGLKMTLAVMLVDALYIGLSFTLITSLLQIKALQIILHFFCLIALLYFGFSYIKKAKMKKLKETLPESTGFIYGLKLTLINPLTIVFWSGTFGSLFAGDNLLTREALILYALGAVFATFAFLFFTSLFGHFLNKFMNVRVVRYLDYSVGTILILYGLLTFF